MRLFIAIDLNQRVKDYLYGLQREIAIPEAALSFSSGFHITLKFLGEVSEERLASLKSTLREIKFSSFKIRTSGVGFFKKKNQIKVVWSGVEPKEEIEILQKRIERNLLELGFERDKKFHPHITIARVKKLKDKEKFIEKLKNIEKREIYTNVDSFVLFRSQLTSQGPIYTVIEKFKAES